ncbi:hypothetical protein [Nannocystis radixulma]|uniref:Oxidoreductase molybdopterin binding domain-containing protein n=1 Tax=Nannocystis radixulma TaxID=2995305 RepID=A0ABT5BBW7_9BACT|nr:hypothetical protein [Nannocystis radixulma]MDC0670928.1 hypothetical protein [Nannocystis radixulma]
MLRSLVVAVALAVSACSTAPAGALEVQTATRSESLTAARLAELPQVQVTVKDKQYAGPRLREALLVAGVPAGFDVEVVGADGYKQTVDAATVGRDDVIVALGLPTGEGPLKLVVPGSPGLSVRQVIALRATPATGS